ncbi:MAG: hypothetical protein RIS70_1712 [Planctomycetota bacterium]|jgi:mono/diheme cytochrome c family protein
MGLADKCGLRSVIWPLLATVVFVSERVAVPLDGEPRDRSLFSADTVVERTEGEAVADGELYAKRIQPLFKRHCFECHSESAEEVKGNLRLDSYEAILKGGNNGEAVTPGDTKSFLLRVLRYEVDDYKMPPRARLPDEDIKDVERWIKAGAPGPKKSQGRSPAKKPEDEPQEDPVKSSATPMQARAGSRSMP